MPAPEANPFWAEPHRCYTKLRCVSRPGREGFEPPAAHRYIDVPGLHLQPLRHLPLLAANRVTPPLVDHAKMDVATFSHAESPLAPRIGGRSSLLNWPLTGSPSPIDMRAHSAPLQLRGAASNKRPGVSRQLMALASGVAFWPTSLAIRLQRQCLGTSGRCPCMAS